MIKKSVQFLKSLITNNSNKEKDYDVLKALNGKTIGALNSMRTDTILENLELAEFKVYSQWGDDGIIQFLIDYLKIEQGTFIEFGVDNYKESNTLYLLINNNWRGLIMDGSKSNIENIKKEEFYWKYDITAIPAFVTKENINFLIETNGFGGEAGLLHVDIDGNDYWIWKEINCIKPIIVIIEFNSVFGSESSWTVPYNANFFRTDVHYSNLYYGSSLLSLCDLAEEKGYYFIGCNSNGNNAYFIRKDKISGLKPVSCQKGYVKSKFRESRDKKGNLTFLKGDERLNEIKGLDIFNTRTSIKEKI